MPPGSCPSVADTGRHSRWTARRANSIGTGTFLRTSWPSVFNPRAASSPPPTGSVSAGLPVPGERQFRPAVPGAANPRPARGRSGWRAADLLGVRWTFIRRSANSWRGSSSAAYDCAPMPETRGLEDAVALLRQWNGAWKRTRRRQWLAALAFPHVTDGRSPKPPRGQGALIRNQDEQRHGWKAPARASRRLVRDYNEMLLRVLVDTVEEGKESLRTGRQALALWRISEGRASSTRYSTACRRSAVFRPRAGRRERIGHDGLSSPLRSWGRRCG